MLPPFYGAGAEIFDETMKKAGEIGKAAKPKALERESDAPYYGNDDPSRDPALLEVERGYDGGAPPRGRRSADARYADGPRLERREVRGLNSASTHRAILRPRTALARPLSPPPPRPPAVPATAHLPSTRGAGGGGGARGGGRTRGGRRARGGDARGACGGGACGGGARGGREGGGGDERGEGEVADVPPAAGEAVRAVGLVDARERRPRLAGRDAPRYNEGHTRAPHTAARRSDPPPAPRAPRSRRTCSSSSRPT